MKLGVTLDILNQKDTPAFYADTLANRPAAGFTGRVFISTDTLDLYRDTGTTWVLLSPSSTGTITGSGAAGQVTFFSSASSITGTNDLFYDSGNNRLGINTNAPTAPLDVHSSLSGALMQLNQTSGILDSQIAFQSVNAGKWRIGSYYNSGNYSFGIYDVVNSLERFSVLNTGQTFVGSQTTSSGRLVVNSATSDNHIVAIGATAPSIRINNAGTGATRLIGLGLATGVNNFIQGTTGGEMAIFNSSTTASAILFGIYDAGLTNTQEAARISAARNFLVGSSVDSGQKLQVSGTALITGAATFNSAVNANSVVVKNSGVPAAQLFRDLDVTIVGTAGQTLEFGARSGSTYIAGATIAGTLDNPATTGSLVFQTLNGGSMTTKMSILNNGYVGIGTTSPSYPLSVTSGIGDYTAAIVNTNVSDNAGLLIKAGVNSGNDVLKLQKGNGTELFLVNAAGNVGIGTTTPTSKLQISTSSAGVASVGAFLLNENTNLNTEVRLAFAANANNDIATNRYSYISSLNTSGSNGQALTFATNATGSAPVEAARITSSQNVLIGTTTDAGQKLQVNGDVNGSSFVSTRGLVSVAPLSATTFFTPSSVGLYIAHVFLSGNNTQTWDAAIIFLYNATNILTFTQVNGVNVQLSVSGTNVQVTQLGGATFNFNYDVIKIR